MEDNNSKILELASNLAHNKTFNESGDILLLNENDMYKKPGDIDYQEDILTYTEEIQDRFNEYYDYFFTEISKIFKEPRIYVLNTDDITDSIFKPENKYFDKEKFKIKAEEKGTIYSANGFMDSFNLKSIPNSATDYILID